MNKTFLLPVIALISVSCATKAPYQDPVPTHKSLTISSTYVNEDRVINIWTPIDYEEGSKGYPVLYMPDGGIKEDFPHIANSLAQLIEHKIIPPLILVGIENTNRRRDLTGVSAVAKDSLYCPLTDGAANFRAFITKELIPEIEKKYSTTGEKGIIGESLAGLFVMETLFLSPSTFDYYIAFDPSLWWNDHYLERHAADYLDEFPEKKISLWFAGSGVKDISIHTNNLAKTLKEKSPSTLRWIYSDEPKEKHHTLFRATKEKAIRWTFGNNELVDAIKQQHKCHENLYRPVTT